MKIIKDANVKDIVKNSRPVSLENLEITNETLKSETDKGSFFNEMDVDALEEEPTM